MGSAPLRQPQYPTAIYFHNSSLLWRNICHFLITWGHHYNTLWDRPLAQKTYKAGWLSLELAFDISENSCCGELVQNTTSNTNQISNLKTQFCIYFISTSYMSQSSVQEISIINSHGSNHNVSKTGVKLCTLNLRGVSCRTTKKYWKLCLL